MDECNVYQRSVQLINFESNKLNLTQLPLINFMYFSLLTK